MLTIYCLEYIYCKCTIILFACMWTIMLMYIHYKSTYYRLIIQPRLEINMLTYSFENTGSDSLYEYLYKCIKNDILKNELAAGYKLPSKRSFAKNLGVSTITVENAYAQLIAEGYIYSVPKKGFYVSDIEKNNLYDSKKTCSQAENRLTLNISANPSYAADSYNTFSVNNSNDYKFDFTSNRTLTGSFPFYTWSKLMKNVIADSSYDMLTPSPSAGVYPLRKAISQHLYDFRGMNIRPEQIIVGAGTEYLYSLLINLLGRDKTFAVEDPGYSKIRQIYEANNVNCVSIPIDDDGININNLNDSNCNVIHISPSHHYPTGIVTTVSRRYELLSWASKNADRFIIEDDYDSEFRLMGKPIPSLQSIDVSDKVIYMNTFTKSLAPTIRISYMVLPIPLLDKFYKRLYFYSSTVSNFEQYTLCRFIEDGYFEKHINHMRIFYKKQRDTMISAINNSPLAHHASIQEKDAGLHFLMAIDTKLSDEELIRKTADNNIRISCLSQYYYNKSNAIDHTLIMNYSAIDTEKIEEAVNALAKVLI